MGVLGWAGGPAGWRGLVFGQCSLLSVSPHDYRWVPLLPHCLAVTERPCLRCTGCEIAGVPQESTRVPLRTPSQSSYWGYSLPIREPFLGPRQLGLLCPLHTRGTGLSGKPRPTRGEAGMAPTHPHPESRSAVSSPVSGGGSDPFTPNFSSDASERSVKVVFPMSQAKLC